jgi:hypothetical protein
MSKRMLFSLPIAVCVGLLVYFIPKGVEPVGEAKQPEASAVRMTAEPLEWDRVIRGRPGRESIDSLRGRLLEMGAAGAVAEIEGFLASGKDGATGQDFEIGSGGAMKGWPTLRVFLLDLLLEIDPAAAARIGREILTKPTSADEWALALRNVARGEASDADPDFLRTKTEELIANPEWRAEPSVGFLNAFDVLVHTRAIASAPLLSGLIQDKDRRDLAHAAFLTLDRLVQRETVSMLERLQADRALRESRPEMTAQQFARADLRDERQRELVKTWLLDQSRTPLELRNFAGTFPNNNKMISNNLLTTEERVSGEDLRAHDREVLEIVREWREDAEFAPVSEHLGAMEARLSEFVKGAEE